VKLVKIGVRPPISAIPKLAKKNLYFEKYSVDKNRAHRRPDPSRLMCFSAFGAAHSGEPLAHLALALT